MPSQVASVARGVPGVQNVDTAPATHAVVPVDAHAPTPHVAVTGTYPSSRIPLQSSSTSSHVVSLAAGVPGVHIVTGVPATQSVTPTELHAPTPHVVALEAYASSFTPLQLSSTPSQVASFGAGIPGVQESITAPVTQLVLPAATQAPTPHVVATDG